MGLRGLDLSYNGLTKEFVEQARAAGLKVYVWTVDDFAIGKKMCEYGVDGITTNNPGGFVNFLVTKLQ